MNEISEIIDEEKPPPHVVIVVKDTTETNENKNIEDVETEIVNKISESESTKDIKMNGNDLENVIEAELVPAVINATKKDPNLTEILPEDSSDEIINKNLIKCEVPEVSTAEADNKLQCPYCGDKFENIDLIFHFHIYQYYKDKKKEYFRKLKRRNLASEKAKGTSTVSTTPRAPTPQPSQANATSENPIKSEKIKRFRKKKEFIRTGALVPDVIRISNYISCSRMNSKTYKSRCKNLTKNCKEQELCVAHKSWINLKSISSKLTTILNQSDEPTTDWLQGKRIHMGNYSFLDLAVNSPELWEEIETIIKLVRSFNESRIKVISFRSTILSHHINSKNRSSIKVESSTKPSERPIAKRLSEEFTYSEKVFKEISIKAFLSENVREVFSNWEGNNLASIESNEAVDLVLDYIRMEFPRISDWNSKKLLARISKNWNDRLNIQTSLNSETLNKVKVREFEERVNTDNILTINNKVENNDALNAIINEVQQSELEW